MEQVKRIFGRSASVEDTKHGSSRFSRFRRRSESRMKKQRQRLQKRQPHVDFQQSNPRDRASTHPAHRYDSRGNPTPFERLHRSHSTPLRDTSQRTDWAFAAAEASPSAKPGSMHDSPMSAGPSDWLNNLFRAHAGSPPGRASSGARVQEPVPNNRKQDRPDWLSTRSSVQTSTQSARGSDFSSRSSADPQDGLRMTAREYPIAPYPAHQDTELESFPDFDTGFDAARIDRVESLPPTPPPGQGGRPQIRAVSEPGLRDELCGSTLIGSIDDRSEAMPPLEGEAASSYSILPRSQMNPSTVGLRSLHICSPHGTPPNSTGSRNHSSFEASPQRVERFNESGHLEKPDALVAEESLSTAHDQRRMYHYHDSMTTLPTLSDFGEELDRMESSIRRRAIPGPSTPSIMTILESYEETSTPPSPIQLPKDTRLALESHRNSHSPAIEIDDGDEMQLWMNFQQYGPRVQGDGEQSHVQALDDHVQQPQIQPQGDHLQQHYIGTYGGNVRQRDTETQRDDLPQHSTQIEQNDNQQPQLSVQGEYFTSVASSTPGCEPPGPRPLDGWTCPSVEMDWNY